jgi:hypothetical protein
VAAPTRTKSALETKAYPINLAALLSVGATLDTVQMTASRAAPMLGAFPLQQTTLAGAVSIGDGTIQLHANPGVGALLIIRPGQGDEERVKVTAISGTEDPFTATITPVAWAGHSNSDPVSYEPGVNARLFADDTPTPSGTSVTPMIRLGSQGQTYRISALATANDNQVVEDEFTLVVSDIATVGTNIKQPSETRDLAMDFANKLAEAHQAGATISSATLYVSSLTNTATAQLGADAAAGASTITMNAHPGVGAMLIVTPAGTGVNPAERVYVSSVSGSGPTWDATILPSLEFAHTNGADITVYQGYSGAFVTSPTSTISLLEVINRARRGQAGQSLRLMWLATTSQGEVLQSVGTVELQEV